MGEAGFRSLRNWTDCSPDVDLPKFGDPQQLYSCSSHDGVLFSTPIPHSYATMSVTTKTTSTGKPRVILGLMTFGLEPEKGARITSISMYVCSFGKSVAPCD